LGGKRLVTTRCWQGGLKGKEGDVGGIKGIGKKTKLGMRNERMGGGVAGKGNGSRKGEKE